jgi:hypothetical protein
MKKQEYIKGFNVKVMENKTGTSAFFSIAMKVEVRLCICLHGKDAAKMF